MIRRSIAVSILLSCMTLTAWGQELASWHCLPEETIVAARVPGGHDFIDALRTRTRLGAVLLSDERIERFKAIFLDHHGDDWDDMVAAMNKYGVEPDDYLQLFRGEVGTSLLIEQVEGRPMIVTLSWGEPGEASAERLVGAIAAASGEMDIDGFAVTREDIELAGVNVIELTIPAVELAGELDFDAEWQREPDEDAPPAFDDDQDEADDDEIQPRVVNHTHVMVAQLGGRVLVATAVTQLPEDVRAAINAGDEVDIEQWTGTEQARGVFARFIAAHDGEGGAFAQRLVDVPGMNNALPDGDTAMEVYASTAQILQIVQTLDTRGEVDAAMIDKLGLNGIDIIGWRMSLDGQNLRNGAFIQMPTPRTGIPAMFEQPEQAPQPPAWVPADVYQYQHISLDLGELYTAIKQLAIEIGGEETGFYFQMAEAQAMQMIQADMATVLSALGTRHSILTYVPTLGEAPGEEGDAAVAVPMQRIAIVWELKDEMVWQKMLQMVGAFAQAGGGQMQFAEEQGFTGWRYTQPPMEGGLFIGKGFMVLGIGPGAVENALASVNHPPDGDAALVNTPEAQRAGDLLTLRPGLMYQLSNASRHMESIREIMVASFNSGLAAQAAMMDPAQVSLFRDLQELMPSNDEMQGIVGVGVGQAWIDEHGVSAQSVLELPPAD